MDTKALEKCPKCNSEHTDRIAVDIGIGTQFGPLECSECGYSELEPEAFTVYDYEDEATWDGPDAEQRQTPNHPKVSI